MQIVFLSAAVSVAATRYAALDGGHAAPFTNGWAGAATNIQLAVEACVDGDTVVVSNGVYNTDARQIPGYGSQNRVYITNAIVVRSLNGPAVTVIEGEGPLGNNAVRGVYMSAGMLLGFTVTNGHTRTSGTGNYYHYNKSGGGVNMYGGDAVISNCVICGNYANYNGGGVYSGTVLDCMLRGNSAGLQGGGARSSAVRDSTLVGNGASEGGGAAGGPVSNCVIMNSVSGGGAYYATIWHCLLSGNSGGGARESVVYNSTLRGNHGEYGGGLGSSVAYNCLVCNNTAVNYGGGSYGGTLYNCTVVSNAAINERGGGATFGGLTNCIVWGNVAPLDSNHYAAEMGYCCSLPLPDGDGNTNADPLFVNAALGNYHLQDGSLCIDTGTNLPWMGDATDLDGNPRILPPGGTVDMGCYEAVPEPASWGALVLLTIYNLRFTVWGRRQ